MSMWRRVRNLFRADGAVGGDFGRLFGGKFGEPGRGASVADALPGDLLGFRLLRPNRHLGVGAQSA